MEAIRDDEKILYTEIMAGYYEAEDIKVFVREPEKDGNFLTSKQKKEIIEKFNIEI